MFWIEFLGPPLLGGILGFVVWYIQSRIEKIQREQEKLHDDRRIIYSEILEPYIKLLTQSKSDAEIQNVARQITSLQYRKKAYEFTLIGDDNVVIAFNNLMQYAFNSNEEGSNLDTSGMMKLWGDLLLEIRKSVNNPNTSLTNRDMLRGFIKDIDKYL
ncbi:MAG: hypothetical protein WD038_04295 [Balneolales bacterium]